MIEIIRAAKEKPIEKRNFRYEREVETMTGIERIARASGCDVQTIRMLLRSEKCVFGTALKKEGGKNFIYILYPEKVKELFGVEVVERTEHDTRGSSSSIGS